MPSTSTQDKPKHHRKVKVLAKVGKGWPCVKLAIVLVGPSPFHNENFLKTGHLSYWKALPSVDCFVVWPQLFNVIILKLLVLLVFPSTLHPSSHPHPYFLSHHHCCPHQLLFSCDTHNGIDSRCNLFLFSQKEFSPNHPLGSLALFRFFR